jgi:eukaryotic-like serine/threonine-protein kinase
MAAAGDRIGNFTLVRQLGAGGMGETWEAVRQTGHDFEQRVAIKLAAAGTLDSPDALAAFRSEAALAASLRHPNIAGVLDIDERSGHIVCELVDGADLRAVLRAAPGGKLEVAVLVHVLAQIARGLSHAHRRVLRGKLSPVIHRDMSPGNVVVDYDGNVKIVDFGIAKATATPDVSETIKGKLSYMAPEQAMGVRMDGRADQYAVGVIAYEALTAARPNDGAHEGETLACILGGRHVPLGKRAPHVNPAFVAVIERMLALRPEQRFASMEAVLDALVPFTPSYTIHRELVPLVVHARQPHTIVRENGQFVSRPVAAVPSLAVPSAELAAALSEEPVAGPRPKGTPRRSHAAMPVIGHSARNLQGRALAGPMQSAQALISTLSANAPAPVEPATVVRPRPKPPAAVPHDGETAVSVRADSRAARSGRPGEGGALERLLASRGFWQALTLLGAVMLGLVAWIALSPDALLWLGPSASSPTVMPTRAVFAPGPPAAAATTSATPTRLAQGSELGAAASAKPAAISGAGDALKGVGSDPPPSAAGAAERPTLASSVSGQRGAFAADAVVDPVVANLPLGKAGRHHAQDKLNGAAALVRVKVIPRGRVWIDHELRGEANPGLEISLAPGKHVVAAGRDAPIESRSIELQPGASELVAFEIDDK